jgi:hypothetical protein
MQQVDRAVLTAFERELLDEAAVERIVEQAAARLEPALERTEATRTTWQASLATVEHEIANLTTAVAAGGDLPPLIQALKDREQQRQDL